MSAQSCTIPECKVEGCDRPRRSLGCCMAHYNQWHTTGIEPTRPFTDEARFYKYVDERGIDECWHWLAKVGKTGYGQFRLKGKHLGAHRVSYQFSKGTIPDGLVIRHTCDNRKCVNPNHLLSGTYKDNTRDAVERGRHPRGESQGRAKLTLAQVVEIREITRNGRESQRSMARRFGVHKSSIQRVAAGHNWIGLGENA